MHILKLVIFPFFLKKKTQDILCDECGMLFRSEKNLQIHKISSVHSKQPTFQCPECPRKFFYKTKMKLHMKRHQNLKYVCETCGLECTSPKQLYKHISKLLHISNSFLISTSFLTKTSAWSR